MGEFSPPLLEKDIQSIFVSGYFLLFECMLESIIYARDHYLNRDTGLGTFLLELILRFVNGDMVFSVAR